MSAAVAAALLDQGRVLHGTTLALTVAAVVLGPPWVAVAAVAVVAVESYVAVRVGLDARLFAQLADGLAPAALDAGLLEAGLVRALPPDRPIAARVAGGLRLLGLQAALAGAQGALVLAALAVR